MFIGSCNWSENSQRQAERVAILQLCGRGAERENAVLGNLSEAGEEWDLSRQTPAKRTSSVSEVSGAIEKLQWAARQPVLFRGGKEL